MAPLDASSLDHCSVTGQDPCEADPEMESACRKLIRGFGGSVPAGGGAVGCGGEKEAWRSRGPSVPAACLTQGLG